MSYHSFDICVKTSGIDNLLKVYAANRNETVQMMLRDPNKLTQVLWKNNSPLAIDNECRCKMGKGELRSAFSCAQCKNLRRLNYKLDCVTKPFRIECGSLAGKNLIVKSVAVDAPYITFDDDSAERAKLFLTQYKNLNLCGTPDISNMQCIIGDTFTIKTLLSWSLYDIFNSKNLPHIPLLYTAFVCQNTGYSLYESNSIGSFDDMHKMDIYHDNDPTHNLKSKPIIYLPLKSSITRTIIVQLLVILNELSKVNFSHGYPSIKDFVFNSQPLSYMYEGFHVTGDITMQITNFEYSSAMLNNIHYYAKNLKSKVYLNKDMFIPEIIRRNVATAKCDINGSCSSGDVYVYRVTSDNVNLYDAMRNIGCPIFVGSFDFYCYMVSLMSDKSFHDSVFRDKKLYKLWTLMWSADDLITIEKNIKEAHDLEPMTKINVINIIRGAWLRCDIIDYMWSLVKKGW